MANEAHAMDLNMTDEYPFPRAGSERDPRLPHAPGALETAARAVPARCRASPDNGLEPTGDSAGLQCSVAALRMSASVPCRRRDGRSRSVRPGCRSTWLR